MGSTRIALAMPLKFRAGRVSSLDVLPGTDVDVGKDRGQSSRQVPFLGWMGRRDTQAPSTAGHAHVFKTCVVAPAVQEE